MSSSFTASSLALAEVDEKVLLAGKEATRSTTPLYRGEGNLETERTITGTTEVLLEAPALRRIPETLNAPRLMVN
jgi:hypothetical protein